MAEIRKIIFIKNAVETLGYFSEQIARELERNGYETCFIDYERMYESMDVMLHFLDREEKMCIRDSPDTGNGGGHYQDRHEPGA